MKRLLSLIALSLLFGEISAQSGSDLLEAGVFERLQSELSGELAKDHVIAITRYHRIQGSRGYSDAARYVLEQLRRYGFQEQQAWIESFKSDGEVEYQSWQSPSGWAIESAELRMVQPHEELIVRYPEIAMSVITYSNPGRVRAELVDVGSGAADSDYEGKEVAGKLVLASGYGGSVHRLAVLKYGAAAVICYLDDERARRHPDMIRYTGMWPRRDELPHVSFGFNLSNRQGRRLKDLLDSGKQVILDAWVGGRGLEPWKMDVVVAVVRGSDPEGKELIYTAHLDHPKESANDNASGSAALLDMARTFEKLINRGELPRPHLTLRFLWVPEFYGTMAYIDAHPEVRGPEWGGKVLAGLNLDMVGEHLELLHSRMNLSWMPPTISSALGDVTAAVAERVDGLDIVSPRGSRSNFNFRVAPYSGGSDHAVLNDGAIGVPAMMLGHWPDYTHHSSEDTPDKVDPVELKRSELIAAAAFWSLASLDEQRSLRLANLVATNAQTRLLEEAGKAVGWLLEASSADVESTYHEAKNVIAFALEREHKALAGVQHFGSFDGTRKLVETWRQGLEGQAEAQRRTLHAIFYQRTGRSPLPKRLNREEVEANLWVPRRLTRGPLAGGLPQLRLPEERRQWYSTPEADSLNTYYLVNLIDGKRSVLRIRDDLTAVTRPISLAAVNHFLRDLETAGLIELRQAGK